MTVLVVGATKGVEPVMAVHDRDYLPLADEPRSVLDDLAQTAGSDPSR